MAVSLVTGRYPTSGDLGLTIEQVSFIGMKRLYAAMFDDDQRHFNPGYTVFTQKHYVSVADVLLQKRLEIRGAVFNGSSVRNISPWKFGPPTPEQEEQLKIVNDITLALCKLFAKDNPKFKEFTFIAAVNRDVHDEPTT